MKTPSHLFTLNLFRNLARGTAFRVGLLAVLVLLGMTGKSQAQFSEITSTNIFISSGTTTNTFGYIGQGTTITGVGTTNSTLSGYNTSAQGSNGSDTVLFIYSPGNETSTGTITTTNPTSYTVTVSGLTITSGESQGGTANGGGGGGGAGLGGGAFVGAGATVTLDNVNVTGNTAAGGNAGGSGDGDGGGGGIGGDAGNTSQNNGGGLFTNNGGGIGGVDGGFGGGGGGGGFGGFGGGGGDLGGGGFGGGGGVLDGGGFGGGGGGFGGGGGAGFGGGLFVQNGGAVIVTGDSTIAGNTVTAGAGLSGGNNGAAAGADIFMMSGSIVTLAPGTGDTITIGSLADNTNSVSDVADDTVYSLPGNDGQYTAGNAVTTSNPGGILDIGGGGYAGGTVILYGENTYAGGTVITSNTTLEVSQDSNLGAYSSSNSLVGNLTLAGGGELLTDPLMNGTDVFTTARNISITDDGTLAAFTGTTATYTGALSGTGALTIGDGTNNGTVNLTSGTNGFNEIVPTTINIASGATAGLFGYIGQATTITGSTNSTLSGFTVTTSGNGSDTPLFIYNPNNETASGAASPSTPGYSTYTVSVSNVTITGGLSQGGNSGYGGGGAGLGGGAFVGAGATLVLSNVNVTGNTAQGGSGLGAPGTTWSGGGGIGGDSFANDSVLESDNGGGLFVNSAISGTNGSFGSGGASNNGNGFVGGFGGGGGGVGVGVGDGGDGGFGGGGGTETGGGIGGTGGIGGGSSLDGPGGGGGDGAALGGGLFVQNGATVIVTGNSTIAGNTVTVAGNRSGGSGAAAAGADIFMMSGSSVTLAPGTGNTVTIGDVGDNTNSISDVADDTVYSLTGGTGIDTYTPGNAVTSTNPGGILTIGSSSSQGGTVVLYGENTYAGGTVITNGTTLEVSQDSNLGAYSSSNSLVGNITLSSGGELLTDPLMNDTDVFTTARNISITDDGTLAANVGTTATYSGAISDGTDIAAALTIGDTTGTNDGTVILTGSNTYTGLTTIAAGTLAIGGNGGIAASSGVYLTTNDTAFDISESTSTQTIESLNGVVGSSVNLGSNELTIDTSTTNTFAGVIADGGIGGGTGGSLTLTGTGGLILTGSNSYTGGTTINGGTLEFGSATALGSGPVTLSGGTLEATTNGPITLNVGGGYTQTGGDLVINAYSSTSNDKIAVAGAAGLGGGLVMNFSGYTTATNNLSYTVLTAGGGITGAFADDSNVTTEGLSSTLKAVATIVDGSPDSVIVDTSLSQLPFSTLAGANLTPNQLTIAQYIDARDQNNPNAGFNKLVGGLNTVDANPTNLGPYLNQLTSLNFSSFSGSTAFNNASFVTQALDGYLANHRSADGTFVSSAGGIDDSGFSIGESDVDPGLQEVHSRLLAWSPAPSTGLLSDTPDPVLGGIDMKDNKNLVSSSESANLWNVFISGNVVLAQDFSDSSAGLSHADTTTGAVQAGVDYKITPHFLVGAEFAYGHTDATLDDLGSSATVNTYSPGIYASYTDHGWYANALGSYGFAGYNQQRNVSIGAFSGSAVSNPGGDQIVGDLDGGYDFHHGPWTYGPTFGAQYVHLDVDGYTETGLPGDDLTVNQDEADSLRSSLGGHVSYAIQDAGVIFNPHLSASWQHEFLDQSRGITSQFDGVGAGSFVVQTANPSRDSALVDVGLDAQVNNALTVFTDYTVQAGQSNYFGQSVEAGVKIGF